MILWVRHGQSTWNVLDRMQGQAVHPPLTELGREQAAQAAERLVDRAVTTILSSPTVRAQQTARIIGDRLGLVVQTDALLTEQGLDEPVSDVLTRVQAFLAKEHPGTVVAVSHGDTIGLAVGLLAGRRPALPANCSITSVDPQTGSVEIIAPAD